MDALTDTYQQAPAAPVADGQRTTPQAPPVWDLETRMTAVLAAMDVRLQEASIAHDVNTAHIDTALDLADVIRVPVAAPRAPVDLYPTPAAALLQRALQRLTVEGWCAGAAVDAQGARCLWGVIRLEAGGNYGLESQALDVLMDAIRRQFSGAESVPSFNDAWADARVPLRLLGQAAALADTRGI